jgi:hypothetical protein
MVVTDDQILHALRADTLQHARHPSCLYGKGKGVDQDDAIIGNDRAGCYLGVHITCEDVDVVGDALS